MLFLIKMGYVLCWPPYSKFRTGTNKISCGYLCFCPCVLPKGRNEILFIFTFLRRSGSKYRFQIRFTLLGWYPQAGRQELRRVVNWLLRAESAMAFLILETRLCFSIIGKEVQEHIVSVWYSMFADQGWRVRVPIHLHLSNGRLHIKLLKMHVQFLLNALQGWFYRWDVQNSHYPRPRQAAAPQPSRTALSHTPNGIWGDLSER